jgi:hypothetical protein
MFCVDDILFFVYELMICVYEPMIGGLTAPRTA